MTGLAVTYPFGGVFWDYIQYPAGLRLLGHDVIYLEDPIRWCYDPKQQTFVEDGSDNAACFAANIARFDSDLAGRWFYRDARGETFGLDPKQTEAFCRSADLFLNLSASSVMRDEYRAPARAALLDSDPIYTQAGIISDLAAVDDEGASRRLEQLRHSQVFFTFAENIGNKECRVPDCGLDWKPTRQPVLVDR
ncbi:MAG TPA: hypothetical protein VEF03_03415, partial [Candidatus Binataceae bacterium]|nr:hypothetical protein [Candidatus Binataceae bacterium]